MLHYAMQTKSTVSRRVCRIAWFNKAAAKSRISDEALCVCIAQAEKGQIDDLGGGVFKKRLNDNRHRAIIITKLGRFWVYEYLFSKQNQANISSDELMSFRVVAKAYSSLTAAQLSTLIIAKNLIEICHDHET